MRAAQSGRCSRAGAYAYGVVGSNDCPANSVRLVTDAACASAAAAAKRNYLGMVTNSAAPRGCLVVTSAFLNDHAVGSGSSSGRLLCAVATAAPNNNTLTPSVAPTLQPTLTPTRVPAPLPTAAPTLAPTPIPTLQSTSSPTSLSPTALPTNLPSFPNYGYPKSVVRISLITALEARVCAITASRHLTTASIVWQRLVCWFAESLRECVGVGNVVVHCGVAGPCHRHGGAELRARCVQI